MPPEPVTFERVYGSIKANLTAGAFGAGSRLDARALAEAHGSSITPIRDALYRLAGERLLRVERQGVFSVPVWTADELSFRYAANAESLLLAIRLAQEEALIRIFETRNVGDEQRIQHAYPDVVADLFLSIATATGSAGCRADIGMMNDMLGPARRAEHAVLISNAIRELSEIADAGRSGKKSQLRKLIMGFHRRRMERAPVLVGHIVSLGAARR